jgi:hypothetical protein
VFGFSILKDEMEKADMIFITEGEMDAMVLNQMGFTALSGSAGAGTWKKEWSQYFSDKEVIICYDSDEPGRKGAGKLITTLGRQVKKIKSIDLYGNEASKEHKDITDYFIKDKKSTQGFLDLIRDSPEIQVKDIIEHKDFINNLMNNNNNSQVNTPQDYKDGIFYYAIQNGDKNYLINSLKQYDEINNGSAGLLNLTVSETDLFRFSGDGIIKFLEGEDYFNAGELFLKIKEYIKRFIFLKEENTYDLLSVWVMGTYVFRIFNYFPYIHLNAEKSSGKTLLMEILAPISFNGQITVNSTEAVIFRDIQNNSLTMFLDEVEKLGKEDKERTAGIMSILKTGFNKSGMVKRCDGKNKDKVRSFSTYSPKMFAGINELDDVLRDRVIKIRMFRKLGSEIKERYTESPEILEEQKKIRDDLYIFGLKFGKTIAADYASDSKVYRSIGHLNNRELDIWLPLFIISLIIDDFLKDKIDSIYLSLNLYSRNYILEKQEEDELDNETVKLLTTVNRMLCELNPHKETNDKLYFTTDSVLEYFKKQEDYAWLENKRWLTKKLKNIGIKTEPFREENKVNRVYSVNKTSFDDYLSRYTNINREKNLLKTLDNLFDVEEVVPF